MFLFKRELAVLVFQAFDLAIQCVDLDIQAVNLAVQRLLSQDKEFVAFLEVCFTPLTNLTQLVLIEVEIGEQHTNVRTAAKADPSWVGVGEALETFVSCSENSD